MGAHSQTQSQTQAQSQSKQLPLVGGGRGGLGGRLIYAQDVAVLISSAQQPAIYVPLPQLLQLPQLLPQSMMNATAATVSAWNALRRRAFNYANLCSSAQFPIDLDLDLDFLPPRTHLLTCCNLLQVSKMGGRGQYVYTAETCQTAFKHDSGKHSSPLS